MGHQVVLVENGRLAVERAPEGFDVVLMDCHMPEMDGFEATERLRQASAEEVKRLPIIALTALAMDGDRARCLQAGMNDYITKPIDAHELAAKLAALGAALPTPGAGGIEAALLR